MAIPPSTMFDRLGCPYVRRNDAIQPPHSRAYKLIIISQISNFLCYSITREGITEDTKQTASDIGFASNHFDVEKEI